MRAFQKFATQHDDFIHDLSYDFYGKRLATCSSDQKIKVWDLNDRNEWVLSAEWKAHAGSIWKVEWAHPEFGQILASCSFDRTVCIWEEQEDIDGSAKWQLKATLLDSKGSVQDVKFAPRHLGLKLATCSTDGIVRIYEAIDVTNLSHWSLMEEFEAQKGTSVCAINAVAWNPSPFEKPMLVVGTDDNNVKIWEYNELQRRWVTIETLQGHKGPIHDVDWAPNVGRSYYLLATASKDCTVRVWQLESKVPSDAKSSGEVKQQTASSSALAVTNVWPLEAHKSEVWRVEWNMTGTVLASSGDDGTVHLWKSLTVPSGNHLTQQWVTLAAINTNS